MRCILLLIFLCFQRVLCTILPQVYKVTKLVKLSPLFLQKVYNMSVLYNSVLTLAEKYMLKQKLRAKIEVRGNCRVWIGSRNRDGYGIIRITFRGKRITLTVHRLRYFMKCDLQTLNPRMHVSHLCHNKLCIKMSHLSYETQNINNKRDNCVRTGICSGHRGYPDCILST